jgi:hypothetical protein
MKFLKSLFRSVADPLRSREDVVKNLPQAERLIAESYLAESSKWFLTEHDKVVFAQNRERGVNIKIEVVTEHGGSTASCGDYAFSADFMDVVGYLMITEARSRAQAVKTQAAAKMADAIVKAFEAKL